MTPCDSSKLQGPDSPGDQAKIKFALFAIGAVEIREDLDRQRVVYHWLIIGQGQSQSRRRDAFNIDSIP